MVRSQKKSIIKLASVGAISVVVIVAFSLPLGIIPPLGGFLFPNNGIWNTPGEVPNTQTLTIPGLSNDTTVYRDQWGVPHIYGTNESDISYALGYCMAQDRLLQMDLARRLTEGKLSQILGPSYLPLDEFNLNMMKLYWANKTLQMLQTSTDPNTQQMYKVLLSFCDGVNYYIDHNMNNLPIQFKLLGDKPAPWTPLDTICYEGYMAEMLTWDYSDFENVLLQDALGNSSFLELYGNPLPYQIPICPNYGNYSDIAPPTSITSATQPQIQANQQVQATESQKSGLTNAITNFLQGIQQIPGQSNLLLTPEGIGSNNWVVNGSKTASGYPILCNDMHLDYNLPGIWYEAQLVNTQTDLNVYGFFLAGVPVPIVGHNSYIGWGYTNTAYDVLDWYYYNGINESYYMLNGVPTAYKTIQYQIPVKGQSPVTFTVRETDEGPVFTNDMITNQSSGPSTQIPSEFSGDVFACKWIAQNVTTEFTALYGFEHAHNRAQFDAASRYFQCPAQNMIYADIYGNIAIRPTGLVPIRNDSEIPSWNMGNGTMLYNGSAGQGKWIGYVPFDDLPVSENPSQCYLTSSNQIIAGPEYTDNYSLQNPLDVADGYRAREINNLLASASNITVKTMEGIQNDVYSAQATNLTPYIINVLGNITDPNSLQTQALNILSSWNYQMDMTKAAPTLYNIIIEAMMNATFNDEMQKYHFSLFPSYAKLEQLIRTDPSSHWFDNVSTPQVENMTDMLKISINEALNALQTYYKTSNVSQWIWGNIHERYFPSLLGIGAFSAGPYPANGTTYTITPSYGTNFVNGKVVVSQSEGGSSERLIVDFSNLNNSVSVIPSGESGVSTSKHYTDQLQLYLNGEYHPQYFSATNPSLFNKDWIESSIFFLHGGA